jgi:hypothetical protein
MRVDMSALEPLQIVGSTAACPRPVHHGEFSNTPHRTRPTELEAHSQAGQDPPADIRVKKSQEKHR